MLVNIDTINYRFDYTDFKIDNQNAKGFLYVKEGNIDDNIDVVYNKAIKKIETTFIMGINNSWFYRNNHRLDNKNNHRIELVIIFEDVEEDGDHNIVAKLIDKDNGKLIKDFDEGGNGGTFGSFLNLFCENLFITAEKLGNSIDRVFDKANKYANPK